MNHDNGKLHRGTADSTEINTTSLSTVFGKRLEIMEIMSLGVGTEGEAI